VPFPTWSLQRARGSIDGELFRRLQFSIEREFSQDIKVDPTAQPGKRASGATSTPT